MLIQQLEPYPQIIAHDTKFYHEPELIERDGHLFIRHYLISKHPNTQNWRVENIEQYVKTFIGKPVILAPGFHHVVADSRDEWLALQAPYGIASIEEIVYNPKLGIYDAISQVKDKNVESALRDGYIPKFVSPAVRGIKMHLEKDELGNTIRVFDEWEGMHEAIVKRPATRPIDIAKINETSCRGGKHLCRMKLAAIAEDLGELNFGNEIKNNFASLNISPEKQIQDTNLVDEQKGSNHVDTLLKKMQDELNEANRKAELQQEQLDAIKKSSAETESKLVSVEKERNDLKSKTEAYEQEKAKVELKKALEAKLKTVKMFVKDAELRNKKVDELADKNFKVEDLDVVYENQFLTEDQIKAELETQELAKPTVGIAEESRISTSVQTSKPDARNVKGAMILDEILELRL